jgi:hypothetical protein
VHSRWRSRGRCTVQDHTENFEDFARIRVGKIMSQTPQKHRLLRGVLVPGFGVVVLAISATVFLARPFSESPWEDLPPNPVSIYETDKAIQVVSPFHLSTDPMARLLLINFENDPDPIYVGFEPQAFDDTVHGRGLLVIGWRVDGKVDVFYQTGLQLDPDTYGIAGSGLNAMTERSFSEALFEIGPTGVQANIVFTDLQGRSVHLEIRETDSRPRTPFGLLAPMGAAATNPPALPLVYVDGFYFVRRTGTEYRIGIDGRSHRNDSIPLFLDRARVHFLRYSADPFIVTWNADSEVRLRSLDPEFEAGNLIAYADGVRYELETNGAFREIRRMSRRQGDQQVAIEFTPAFPQLLALADDVEVAGKFRVSAQASLGTVDGSWRIVRQGEELKLELSPDGGWTPGPAPRMARLLFRAVSTFREWPTTYIWRGTIQLPLSNGADQSPLDFHSGWERIAP